MIRQRQAFSMSAKGGRAPSIGTLVACCVLLASGTVSAAGFDCKSAGSEVEILICKNTELSKLDDQMKVLFDKIEGETFGHDAETGETLDPAGKELTFWRKTVRDKCKDVRCLRNAYTARLREMRVNWADALGPSDQ
ncbi:MULTISPECIES: lysozyme inhibitor LprI family protein [Rhizobium]|uniref:Lysozyme inhibitor LprI N-terminal domain-containing protein n=1 Tax=Rhizobium rhododendri TaxID=2506430 RepID=A0ABY8IR62_9HYPH|nr:MULTISPECIES: hypothetical protein [Rhizobium]TQX85195.1 hypothetical protein EQW76_22480 [Rhizobium sp. rho-13.1]TQY09483.1 hypothetical protein EQW74_21685 [Rhizobium sp. rho-1.1]WFS25965.1 hypothetical protein PR018_20840 [Rhizobium rhododendri]